MHIAFVDFIAWNYSIETAYDRPLGGSQSALCYLAEQLAARGHEVQLINNATLPGVSRGVICLPLAKAKPDLWQKFDAVVILNGVKQGRAIRPLLRTGAKLIAWLQHADDQPAVRPLADAEFRDVFDHFAFVSEWQQQRFAETFHIPGSQSRVLRNAIGPAFRGRFKPGQSILAAKRRPAVLAYTSTPFRGLDLLVHAFPAIHAQAKGVTLRVFSSMQVYQMASERNAALYGCMYQLCQDTPGIEYIGAVPQCAWPSNWPMSRSWLIPTIFRKPPASP